MSSGGDTCDLVCMVIKPTYDDVNLILRLYEQRREDKMRTAREWFAQSFKYHTIEEFNRGCPVGSSMNAYARMVLSYWEMAASFRHQRGVASGVVLPKRRGAAVRVGESARTGPAHARGV